MQENGSPNQTQMREFMPRKEGKGLTTILGCYQLKLRFKKNGEKKNNI